MAPIHAACRYGNLAGVKALLFWNGSSKSPEYLQENALEDGSLPIHVACEFGHLSIVQLLVEHAPSTVHARNRKSHSTPLHYASASGHLDIVQYLIEEHEANILKTTKWSLMTPLHCACKGGHLPVVQYLVESAGAPLFNCEHDSDPEVEDEEDDGQPRRDSASLNMTPLDWACQQGHMEVVLYLLGQGATVTAQTLHLGADRGTKILRVLVKHATATAIETHEINKHNDCDNKGDSILISRRRGKSLLGYDWLVQSRLLYKRSFNDVSKDERYWRVWNLLALICHRYYYCHYFASDRDAPDADDPINSPINNMHINSIPPLYQLSHQVDAILTVTKKIKKYKPPTLDEEQTTEEPSALDSLLDAKIEGELEERTSKTEGKEAEPESETQQVVEENEKEEDDNIEYEEVEVEEIVEFERTRETDFCWMLHAATSIPHCPAEVIAFLARLFPGQLCVKRRGLTPLLMACRHDNCRNGRVIATLVDADPRAARIRSENTTTTTTTVYLDGDSRLYQQLLPLTHAMLHHKHPTILPHIFRAYPPALIEFVAYTNLDFLYWLLRTCPAMMEALSRHLNRRSRRY